MKSSHRIKKLPINFDTDYDIQMLNYIDFRIPTLNLKNTLIQQNLKVINREDLEVFMMISNPLKQTADNIFEIIEGIPSDLTLTLISLN